MQLVNREQAKAARDSSRVRHQFSPSSLLGDPFAVGTLCFASISWIVAFIGCITVATDSSSSFPRFSWWGIVYELIFILVLVLLYCYDLIDYYKVFLAAGGGVAFLYTSNSTNNLVYIDGSNAGASSAGFILLSMVNLIWIVYFGGDNASPINRWIDSFSLRGIRPSTLEASIALIRSQRMNMTPQYPYEYQKDLHSESMQGEDIDENIHGHELQSTNYVSSTALNGFENTERNSSKLHLDLAKPNTGTLNTQATGTYLTNTTNGNTETTMGDTLGLYSDIGEELNSFPYTAEALYTYDADATDAYEISFQQGEVLRVGDIEGRWWKAKKSTGETGIIPSNYVKLLDSGNSH